MQIIHWTVIVIFLSLGLPCFGADRTIDEFRAYAADRLPGLDGADLDRFVETVDVNGDGKISESEFSKRLEVLRRMSAPQTPAAGKADRAPVNDSLVIVPPLANTDTYPVLLITADEIALAWKPFAAWKTQLGKATKIITVGQIDGDYQADSIQEKIRQCVREHIHNDGTKWVVLGGDCLPNGNGLVPGGHTTVHAQERQGIPTDIVYLSETDWDADDDGIFGEWDDDREAIRYPDGSVGLGRIPVRTAEDVAAFTEKVIAYESKYPETDFAKQMIYTCTDSPAYPKVQKSWDTFVSKAWTEGEAQRFFSQRTPWDEGKPGSYPLSSDNLVKLINGGTIGKMHIHGHGHLPAWVLENSNFTAKHVNALKNDGAYPLITTVSCNTGEYDSRNDPSIVELMIRKPRGGSVAIVAPIRTGKAHFHKPSDFRLMVREGKLDGTTQTMTRFWCHGMEDKLTTGEALMRAKADMADDALQTAGYHLCICELNLLGDPTLDMRAATPRTPTLDVLDDISAGENELVVSTDAPGATICAWKDKDVYAIANCDESGRAKLRITPSTEGKMSITVSGPSLNAVSEIITVR